MPSADQLRGVMLEEIGLWLLHRAGYRPVFQPGADPTLCNMSGGLGVRGRGTDHQIDAIGDFLFGPPFGHPLRLLVEGKTFGRKRTVPVRVIREAVGVLQDVQQFWIPNARGAGRRRYHYQFGVFSTRPFSQAAQALAFPHDVFLFPLQNSRYLRPVVDEIHSASINLRREFPGRGGGSRMTPTRLRSAIRSHLLPHAQLMAIDGLEAEDAEEIESILPLLRETRRLRGALLGMAARAFPLFLVPAPGVDPNQVLPEQQVEIGIDHGNWYLREPGTGERLFSFDVPAELFRMFAEEGVISPEAAVDMKARYLREIHAFVLEGDSVRTVRFLLDTTGLIKYGKDWSTPKPSNMRLLLSRKDLRDSRLRRSGGMSVAQ